MNHKVVNFHTEIREKADLDITTNLWEQGVNFGSIKFGSKEIKRLFFNYYTKNILEYIYSSDKKPFFIIGNSETTELYQYLDRKKLDHWYITNIQKLLKCLPLKYHINEDMAFSEILNSKESELSDWVIGEITKQSSKISNLSYKGVKHLVDYYDLEYINNQIFEKIKYKCVF